MTDPRMTPTNDAPVTVEQCVAKIMDDRIAYFERTNGYYERADAARSYRATKTALLKALAALASAPAGPDPDTPAYEAARQAIADELRRIAVGEPKSGYREMADRLAAGQQPTIPAYVAMQVMARQSVSAPARDGVPSCERCNKPSPQGLRCYACLSGEVEQLRFEADRLAAQADPCSAVSVLLSLAAEEDRAIAFCDDPKDRGRCAIIAAEFRRVAKLLSDGHDKAIDAIAAALARPHSAVAPVGNGDAIREALLVVRGSVSDLRKGFAKYVDPARWVEQVVAHIDAALARPRAAVLLRQLADENALSDPIEDMPFAERGAVIASLRRMIADRPRAAVGEREARDHVDREHLQQVADGAFGDGPFTRGAARDQLAALQSPPAKVEG